MVEKAKGKNVSRKRLDGKAKGGHLDNMLAEVARVQAELRAIEAELVRVHAKLVSVRAQAFTLLKVQTDVELPRWVKAMYGYDAEADNFASALLAHTSSSTGSSWEARP